MTNYVSVLANLRVTVDEKVQLHYGNSVGLRVGEHELLEHPSSTGGKVYYAAAYFHPFNNHLGIVVVAFGSTKQVEVGKGINVRIFPHIGWSIPLLTLEMHDKGRKEIHKGYREVQLPGLDPNFYTGPTGSQPQPISSPPPAPLVRDEEPPVISIAHSVLDEWVNL